MCGEEFLYKRYNAQLCATESDKKMCGGWGEGR